MRKLKICYLADWRSIHTQRWLKYFFNNGHEIHLISDNPQECQELKDVKLYNFVIKGEDRVKKISWKLYLVLRSLRLRRLLKKINPDILHSHFVSYYGWWGAKSGFHPFVLTAWGSDIYVIPQESAIGKAQIEFALKNADLITSDAESLREETIALGASEKNNYVIQWGIDFKRFNPDVKCDGLREKLGFDNSLVVLSPRSFISLYNIDVIIKSIPLVMREIPNVTFILMRGYGNQETENELNKLAQELGIEDKIRFIDFVLREEIPQYYKLADILVSIPSSDATSSSLLEGMACGVAPIVSDLPSTREWIKDGENGLVIPPKDSETLGKVIIKLLKNKTQRELFAKRNIALIKEKADHKKHMDDMEQLYYGLKGISK